MYMPKKLVNSKKIGFFLHLSGMFSPQTAKPAGTSLFYNSLAISFGNSCSKYISFNVTGCKKLRE